MGLVLDMVRLTCLFFHQLLFTSGDRSTCLLVEKEKKNQRRDLTLNND